MRRIINVDWSGPFGVNQIGELDGHDQFGLYQIYGPHPVYGNQQLLYIGKASARSFAVRLAEHGWIHGTRDTSQVSVYIGRLCGSETPDNKVWEEEIDLAERLLIYAHFPPYNTQKWLIRPSDKLEHVHVLNWNQYRDLLPEVSGLRWIESGASQTAYRPYSNIAIKDPVQFSEPATIP
jgi:hypothetical protein